MRVSIEAAIIAAFLPRSAKPRLPPPQKEAGFLMPLAGARYFAGTVIGLPLSTICTVSSFNGLSPTTV